MYNYQYHYQYILLLFFILNQLNYYYSTIFNINH